MKLIVASTPSGGIGYKNKLPWDTTKKSTKIEGDLFRFRTLTDGGVIVMGRNTWESLPTKPLPNRIHFVVTSKNIEYTNSCFTIPNLDYISNFKNAWIIGGAKLIETNWHIITEIHLTKTITEYPCDTFINLNYIHNMFNLIFVNSKKDHTYQVWKRE